LATNGADPSQTLVIELDLESMTTLAALSRSRITSFLAGRNEPKQLGESHLYRVADLVLESEHPVIVGGSSHDVGDRDELISIFAAPYDPNRWRSHPPRQRIDNFPDDLELNAFLARPLEIRIVRSEEAFVTVEGTQAPARVDSAILLEEPAGNRLLIEAPQDMPRIGGTIVRVLDIVITTDVDVIDQRLARRQVRPFAPVSESQS
jgi:hypothetical protein